MRIRFALCCAFLAVFLWLNAACQFQPSISVEEIRTQVDSEAAAILSQDPCQATLEDVRDALETAAEAQKVPDMDETANKLIEWAKDGFQSYASGRVAAGADVQERTELAVTAQQLGLDQLADDLLAGRVVVSPCEEEWQGTIDWTFILGDPNLTQHLDFSFIVYQDGKIVGSGTGTHTERFASSEGCSGPLDICCIQYVQNPYEGLILGMKTQEFFGLDIFTRALWENTACGLPLPESGVPLDTYMDMYGWEKADFMYKIPIPTPDQVQIDCSTPVFTCHIQIFRP